MNFPKHSFCGISSGIPINYLGILVKNFCRDFQKNFSKNSKKISSGSHPKGPLAIPSSISKKFPSGIHWEIISEISCGKCSNDFCEILRKILPGILPFILPAISLEFLYGFLRKVSIFLKIYSEIYQVVLIQTSPSISQIILF